MDPEIVKFVQETSTSATVNAGMDSFAWFIYFVGCMALFIFAVTLARGTGSPATR
jgi:hypothetical protein